MILPAAPADTHEAPSDARAARTRGFLMRPSSRRTATRWALAALLAVGVAARLRLYASCPSYWYDEAYLLLNVFRKSCLELLGPLRDDQAAPPLFLWALRGLYAACGGGERW